MAIVFIGFFFASLFAADDSLIARGEHRIEVQNYGRRDPEIPISIMQSHYYNEHHGEYMIRIEDLNRTLNKEINQEVNEAYDQWFDAEFNRRLSEYIEQQYGDQASEPANENPLE